ncbi:hypothetical protein [Streptomyces mordarskii]|uniref:hypothetical protein n=1 Tax=Streptomyces mordarskii TaxID=1226758 RepID=UPI0031F77A65
MLEEIAAAEPPAEVADDRRSVDRWRADMSRTAQDRVYERVTDRLSCEALKAIEEKGIAFWPVEWEESSTPIRVQGEWTVDVSVRGTDHVAVREAFAADLARRRDEIVADAGRRIPRIKGTFPEPRITPEKVRKAWQRDRRRGTAPKPASRAFAPGSWVTWLHPVTGRKVSGIVTRWLPGERVDSARRTVIPSDGSEPVALELAGGATSSVGPWVAVYGEGLSSLVEPGAEQLEFAV